LSEHTPLLDVLFHDEHLIAVNKPAPLAVHSTGQDDDHLIARVLEHLNTHNIPFEPPLAPANRLDRGTSGLVLVPLTADARHATAERFAQREVRKVYWAMTLGRTRPKGAINRPLKPPGKDPKPQPARTRYRQLAATAQHSLLWVQPDTGRTHQVRRHLAGIGHPILGDTRHGVKRGALAFRQRFNVDRHMLHARQLSLAHPITDARLHIVATPNPDWFDILEALGLIEPDEA